MSDVPWCEAEPVLPAPGYTDTEGACASCGRLVTLDGAEWRHAWLSYGEISDQQGLAEGDMAHTPDDGIHVIVEITPSPGDDADNPDADEVRMSNGRTYWREALLALMPHERAEVEGVR